MEKKIQEYSKKRNGIFEKEKIYEQLQIKG